jgi:hypothetical protein
MGPDADIRAEIHAGIDDGSGVDPGSKRIFWRVKKE